MTNQPPPTATDITLDEDQGRFEAATPHGPAVLRFRKRGDDVVDFASTFTPPPARGQGLAGRITAHALDWAREKGYKVVPSCPFVADYVRDHPEYQDLVAD